ncbi:MAG TPA: hypothetical protein VNW97_14930 [Candidatus Saccharimonadales bacterium]|nr:hypothetical protein [Candidatus Saccharimonadales bacterium]
MKFLEKGLVKVFCGLLTIVASAGLSAAQQPTSSAPSSSTIRKAHLNQAVQPPAPFRADPIVAMLAATHSSLSTAPSAITAKMWSGASFPSVPPPSASSKKYSIFGAAKANFLAPAKSQVWKDRDFNTSAFKGLNSRTAKHPAEGDFQK